MRCGHAGQVIASQLARVQQAPSGSRLQRAATWCGGHAHPAAMRAAMPPPLRPAPRRSAVNLLRVGGQSGALEVLAGVKVQHWPLIKQVAAEVHEDVKAAALELLRGPAGFTRVVAGECGDSSGPGVHMIWATRPPCGAC